jgi:hypothetical protein
VVGAIHNSLALLGMNPFWQQLREQLHPSRRTFDGSANKQAITDAIAGFLRALRRA